jgi:hypothetical protein
MLDLCVDQHLSGALGFRDLGFMKSIETIIYGTN